MSFYTTVTIPKFYMLWSPSSGPILGTFGLTYLQAHTRLADRKANGEAFPQERVKIMRVKLTILPHGEVNGYIVPVRETY